jgi:hypothetical protein
LDQKDRKLDFFNDELDKMLSSLNSKNIPAKKRNEYNLRTDSMNDRDYYEPRREYLERENDGEEFKRINIQHYEIPYRKDRRRIKPKGWDTDYIRDELLIDDHREFVRSFSRKSK